VSKNLTQIKLLSLEDSQVSHMITMPLASALLAESAYRDKDGGEAVH
jgi:hypothetical protein